MIKRFLKKVFEYISKAVNVVLDIIQDANQSIIKLPSGSTSNTYSTSGALLAIAFIGTLIFAPIPVKIIMLLEVAIIVRSHIPDIKTALDQAVEETINDIKDAQMVNVNDQIV